MGGYGKVCVVYLKVTTHVLLKYIVHDKLQKTHLLSMRQQHTGNIHPSECRRYDGHSLTGVVLSVPKEVTVLHVPLELVYTGEGGPTGTEISTERNVGVIKLLKPITKLVGITFKIYLHLHFTCIKLK